MAATGLRGALPDFDAAQRIVACSHHAAPRVAFAFPGARHLWRSGPDGADLALLDVLDHEHVAQRFECVTICWGMGSSLPAPPRSQRPGLMSRLSR